MIALSIENQVASDLNPDAAGKADAFVAARECGRDVFRAVEVVHR
jgi:hypothetical protein